MYAVYLKSACSCRTDILIFKKWSDLVEHVKEPNSWFLGSRYSVHIVKDDFEVVLSYDKMTKRFWYKEAADKWKCISVKKLKQFVDRKADLFNLQFSLQEGDQVHEEIC